MLQASEGGDIRSSENLTSGGWEVYGESRVLYDMLTCELLYLVDFAASTLAAHYAVHDLSLEMKIIIFLN